MHTLNFTYTSARLTELTKKSAPWVWGPEEEKCFQVLKEKLANAKCLGVPRPHGEIIVVSDAWDIGGGGSLYQWQLLQPEERNVLHFGQATRMIVGALVQLAVVHHKA